MIASKGKSYFQLALIFGVLFHGVVVFFTFEQTYDAYVHIFFANHYAENWFDHWEYRWYTGFTMVSYPPLIHQFIGLLSLFIGLKAGFILVAIIATAIFIRGVYVFSKLWVDERSAGMACIIAVVSSSYIEALHIFGQLPSITGIAILLNLTPYIYRWIRFGKQKSLILSIGFLCVITSVHHVTTIFGMVFFVFPVIGLALMDNAIEDKRGSENVRVTDFIRHFVKILKPSLILGFFTIFATLITILPYWLWSRSDPITQVPIPHGSRDSFLDVFSSGLIFFLIPWGMMLFFLPFLFKKIYTKRTIILALSFTMAFVLGTGGTTPIPKMVLGETAFNILTLDRFTYWATIMALPFFGYFIHSLMLGSYKEHLRNKYGIFVHRIIGFFWVGGILLTSGLVINISYFQPLQPRKIKIQPILNFLERDDHAKWRYLTLGFGDQMAWLSANTTALTVDGNYHSVRRLPEMTTRKVERLENSKYLGTQGIGALHQFLAVPEKYNLKYIFSNDQFYNPILYFSGWQKLRNLENNIQVWEKPDIPTLPSILPRKEIPNYQQLMWSILPLSFLTLLLIALLYYKFRDNKIDDESILSDKLNKLYDKSKSINPLDIAWSILLFCVISAGILYSWKINKDQYSPENLITAYFDAIDFKEYNKAFGFYDPENSPTLDQILLDLSQEDGITLSYAKLNNLSLKPETNTDDDKAIVKVKAEWITSINTFTTFHNFNLIKKRDKWWLLFDERDVSTPPEPIFSTPTVDFKNQGRREALVTGTMHEDVLDRPEIFVESANLIERNGQYHVVGQLTNIDNDPAYVTVSATLYNKEDIEIVSYNAKEVLIHNLLPKEKTYFRIDFEDIAYQISKSTFPKIYDPAFSNPFTFLEEPVKLVLNIKSVISSAPLNRLFGISDVSYEEGKIKGTFINSGTKECNIPQVISANYINDTLFWVDSDYLERAVRPQRSKLFSIDTPLKENINVKVLAKNNNIIINGQINKRNNQKTSDKGQKSKVHFYEINPGYLVDIIPSGYVANE